MKAEFLKLAGVKTDKQFYAKYPDEKSFFKAHPEAKKMIKKAQAGAIMPMMNSYVQGMQNVPNMQNVIQGQMQSPGVNANMFSSASQPSVGPQQKVSGPTFSPGNYNSWDIDNNGVPDTIQKSEGNPLHNYGMQSQDTQPNNANAMMKGGMNVIGGMFNAANAMKEQKEELKNARMWADVSGVVKRAVISNQFAEKPKNTWIRPDDQNQIANINQLYPGQGVGTNALARNGARLEDGGMIGGNPTEIQNTYGDGNSIYDDLGYTPLIDVNQQKSFYRGGNVPRAEFGIASAGMEGFGQNPYSSLTGSMFNNSGGSQMGSAVGSMFGPVGGLAGGMIGGMFDKTGGKTKDAQQRFQRNMDYVAGIDSTAGIHNQFNSVMEDGGWVSNDWNPQVITKFGDLDDQDYAQFAHKDEFRAGGHLRAYRNPSERAMQTYEDGGKVKSYGLGGELETHWGGGAETMSYNPYLPGTGETVMFRGKSHEERSPNGETGIGVTYGGNPVEVERGEPMVELEEGGVVDPETGEVQKSGVVFGNLKIPNQYIDLLGDPNAKGKKFKNYVADLSKMEEKQNKMMAKSTEELNALDINSSFDRLKLSSLEANIKGGNLKLKEIADKKIKAADLQNAINDTAEEYGIIADDLARGKVKIDKEAMSTRQARLGAAISKAKDGITTTTEQTTKSPFTKFDDPAKARAAGFVQNANGVWYKPKEGKVKTVKEKKSASAMDNIPKQSVDKATGLFGGVTPEQFKAYKEKNKWFTKWDTFDPNDQEDVDEYAKAFNAEAEKRGSKARILPDVEFDPKTKKSVPGTKTKYVGKQFTSANIEDAREEEPAIEDQELAIIDEPNTQPVSYKRNELLDAVGQILPFIRPTDQEPLDPRQLAPEMLAKLQNKLEPVNMQKYNPMLDDLYDISYQDVLNENDSDFLTATRSNNLNPAMRASLLAQKYGANSKVLAEQFRANQLMRDKVFSGNRATLNNAQMTNLGLADQQYQRQQQALSNTKATDLEIAKSYADKYAKNKLENRTLGVHENLYNYRYDKSGRAINMNAPFQPNIPTVASNNGTQRQIPVYEADGKTIKYYQLEEYDPSANGGVGTPPINAVAKNGKSIKKNNKNSSIVKAIKNL
jgi:hypothetical protein